MPIFQSVLVCSFCVFKCGSLCGSAWLWQTTCSLNLPVDDVGLSRNCNVGMYWHRRSPSLCDVPEKTEMFVWCQLNKVLTVPPFICWHFSSKAEKFLEIESHLAIPSSFLNLVGQFEVLLFLKCEVLITANWWNIPKFKSQMNLS